VTRGERASALDHRFDRPPDPRSLSSEEIEDWSRRGLMPDESLSAPTCRRWHRPYWLHLQDQRVGILAVVAALPGVRIDWPVPEAFDL
jgi:hypothetical protein